MGFIAGILTNIVRRTQRSASRQDFIFYKIVDHARGGREYLLQCINTKATFSAELTEIVYDIDILYGLHPIQACYVGIEYSRHIKNINPSTEMQKKQRERLAKYSISRYGKYKLSFQDRLGRVCFVDQDSNKDYLMDPRDIALSERLIEEFDAAQAFYIGLLAGFKLNNPTEKQRAAKPVKIPQLRLVK